MYSPADRAQVHAHGVKQGRLKLSQEQQEIVDWIKQEFGVATWGFWLEKKEEKQLVHLVLDTPDDVKKMQVNRDAGIAIAGKFSNGSEVVVTYRPLKQIDSDAVNEMINDDQRALLKTFESVWTMSQAVIFYFTDDQVRENQSNGVSKRIAGQLNDIAGSYGSNQSPSYLFDSKENFDKNYEGNWYYYWK